MPVKVQPFIGRLGGWPPEILKQFWSFRDCRYGNGLYPSGVEGGILTA